MLLGLIVVALGAGAGLALFLYLLKPTYFSSGGLRKIANLPVLGTVSLYLSPHHTSQRKRQLVSFMVATIALLVVAVSVLVFQDEGVSVMKAIKSSLKA